ncbi:MAG: hypothetical protein KGN76_15195 [Acidobacteriota bacterium]|nr:hypothetical protein [Acidobacteriota bacterium]
MFRKLVKTDGVEVDGHVYAVRYYSTRTVHGEYRYSAEVILAPEDRIIIDDNSLNTLEARLTHLVPATVYCRLLAGRATAA